MYWLKDKGFKVFCLFFFLIVSLTAGGLYAEPSSVGAQHDQEVADRGSRRGGHGSGHRHHGYYRDRGWRGSSWGVGVGVGYYPRYYYPSSYYYSPYYYSYPGNYYSPYYYDTDGNAVYFYYSQ